MRNPFPGMNPFLENEDCWHTFYNGFITECLKSLAPQVEPAYIVQTDENVYIHELPGDQRLLAGRPDAFVSRDAGGAAIATAAGIAAPAYARLPHAVDILREPFLLIRDGASYEVVTVIEVLSPTNKKPGPDRALYLAKRRRYLSAATNLVEIDLLRGWERMPLEDLPACDYCVAVSRPEERPRVAVWPVGLRDRLPEVPVPLRPGEREATLDLQALLNRVFTDLRFGNYIYRNRPQPPLSPEDAAWANGVMSAVGTG